MRSGTCSICGSHGHNRQSCGSGTPIRAWSAKHKGRDYQWLARVTGLSLRTVMRAAAGRAVGYSSAHALSERTGVPLAVLMGRV